MKKVLLYTILWFFLFKTHKANCQTTNLSVFDRHNGIIMQRALALEYNESTKLFYYTKDDNNGQKHLEVRNYDLYNIKGTDNCKYIISIKFYNPLRVKFNFEETNIEDPAINEINNFIDKIPSELYNLNKTFETKNQNKSDVINTTYSFTVDPFSVQWEKYFSSEGISKSYKVSSSIILSQWIYELKTLTYLKDSSIEKSTTMNNLIDEINKIEAADNYLYNEIAIASPDKDTISKNLSDWITSIQNDLYGQVSLSDFKKKLEFGSAICKKLESAKVESENSLTNLFSLMTDKFSDNIGSLIYSNPDNFAEAEGVKERETFREYSKAARQWISLTIAERKRYNDEAVKKLVDYITTLKNFVNQFDEAGYKNLQTSQIDHREGKIKEVKVSAVKLENDGKEISDSKKTVTFRIARWNSAYPFISTGGFFTNFAFPNYSLNIDPVNGASIINSSFKEVRFCPAVFLNFVFSIHNDYIYPVFQIGVGTIDKSILVPVGFGFSIMDRITIAGGFCPGFAKELDKLRLGDNVSGQDELDKDLSYKLMSTGYFGININLNK